MAIKKREELLNSFKSLLGERTDDESLTILEDLSDTLTAMETPGTDDWEQKYKENDEMWRKRYKERFFEGTPQPNPQAEGSIEPGDYASNGYQTNAASAAEMGDEVETPLHIEDLFKGGN